MLLAKEGRFENDPQLRKELQEQYQTLSKRFEAMEFSRRFTGKYDDRSAVVTIHAGTGGTDAQDWSEMLMRMYLRFAEKKGFATSIFDLNQGSEAGIKKVGFEVRGANAYGYFRSEGGVHRLVRISPFDAEKMRHTSFALVEVLPYLDEAKEVVIKPDELKIDVFRAGGHGGQGVNTTDSAVRIRHIPTGITVTCQNERSQLQNKEHALSHLRSRLAAYYAEEREEERQMLRGEFSAITWGNQARSYVLHPYKLVKDHRTNVETQEVSDVLNGDIDLFVEAFLLKQGKK